MLAAFNISLRNFRDWNCARPELPNGDFDECNVLPIFIVPVINRGLWLYLAYFKEFRKTTQIFYLTWQPFFAILLSLSFYTLDNR